MVTCTNFNVNEINEDRLSELPGKEHIIVAMNRSDTQNIVKAHRMLRGFQKKLQLCSMRPSKDERACNRDSEYIFLEILD